MYRTHFLATATERPLPIPELRISTVYADTVEGRKRLVIKPSRAEQQENFAWSFNEFMAARLGVALGVDCLPAYVLTGVPRKPLVGIPFQCHAQRLKDALVDKLFDWADVSNARSLFAIVALDLCVFNSDRAEVNLFLLPQANSRKRRLVAYDHEKAFVGDGEADLHRIEGGPKQKRIEDFFQEWLRRQVFAVAPDSDPAKEIIAQVRDFSEALPVLFQVALDEVPRPWLACVPIEQLEGFLIQWWQELPRLCEERLHSILGATK